MAGNQNSGRNRKPNHLKVVDGTASADEFAGAKAIDNLLTVGDPGCPSFLTREAKLEWKRISGSLVNLHLLTELDRAELAVYCQAWADWKHARQKIAECGVAGFVGVTPSGYTQMSTWMQIANRAEDRMRTSGALFGLNPAARARVAADIPLQGSLFPSAEQETARKHFGG